MEKLETGDWVKTDSGELGKVIVIDHLAAFIEFKPPGEDGIIKHLLISTLTRVGPPEPHIGQYPSD
jgi:hypothetical protein